MTAGYSSPMEEWRPVPGHADYLVSNLGRVASTKVWRGQDFRYLKSQPHSVNGYPYVQLYAAGGKVCRSIHGLVAAAFLGPRPDDLEVCHNDGDPENARLDNLRYDTHAANEADKVRHGTNRGRETQCINGHEFDEVNTHVDPRTGRRYCRPCTRVNSRNYRARKMLRAANVVERAA